MIGPFVLSLSLLGLAGLLIDQHRRAWALAQSAPGLAPGHRRFARSQYLRRLSASSAMGFVGALFALQPLVPRRPLPLTLYLAALILACSLMLFCGLLDAIANFRFYRHEAREQREQQASVAVELAQAKRQQANAGGES